MIVFILSFPEFIACVCSDKDDYSKEEVPGKPALEQSRDLDVFEGVKVTSHMERNADPSTSQAQDGPE